MKKEIGDDDGDVMDHAHNNEQGNRTCSTVQIAVCATIVDDFPHEALWRKWMDETGGEFLINDDNCDDNMAYFASAEMYVHAKNPERIQSEWLR